MSYWTLKQWTWYSWASRCWRMKCAISMSINVLGIIINQCFKLGMALFICFSDVTWASRGLKSQTTLQFVKQLVNSNNKWNKLCITDHLWGESIVDRNTECGKHYHVMTRNLQKKTYSKIIVNKPQRIYRTSWRPGSTREKHNRKSVS